MPACVGELSMEVEVLEVRGFGAMVCRLEFPRLLLEFLPQAVDVLILRLHHLPPHFFDIGLALDGGGKLGA